MHARLAWPPFSLSCTPARALPLPPLQVVEAGGGGEAAAAAAEAAPTMASVLATQSQRELVHKLETLWRRAVDDQDVEAGKQLAAVAPFSPAVHA